MSKMASHGSMIKGPRVSQQSNAGWRIVKRTPKEASVTVEVRSGSSARTVELKGVPASTAYFAVKGPA